MCFFERATPSHNKKSSFLLQQYLYLLLIADKWLGSASTDLKTQDNKEDNKAVTGISLHLNCLEHKDLSLSANIYDHFYQEYKNPDSLCFTLPYITSSFYHRL